MNRLILKPLPEDLAALLKSAGFGGMPDFNNDHLVTKMVNPRSLGAPEADGKRYSTVYGYGDDQLTPAQQSSFLHSTLLPTFMKLGLPALLGRPGPTQRFHDILGVGSRPDWGSALMNNPTLMHAYMTSMPLQP